MDVNSIRKKLEALQTQNNRPTGESRKNVFWKPTVGKQTIRIVPSKYTPQFPFKEFMVHYGFGKFPIPALTNWGEKDPIVEFSKKLRQSNDREEWAMAKQIEPKMRIFAPVIVRGEEDKGVRLWEFGKNIYLQLLGMADDEDYGDYTDVSEGRDFTVEAVMGDVGGRQGLKTTLRIKPKQTPLSQDADEIEKWLDNQPDILEIQYKMEFDQMKEVLRKWLSPEDNEEGDEEEDAVEEVKAPVVTKQKYQAPAKPDKSKSFDDLFDEEDDLPF